MIAVIMGRIPPSASTTFVILFNGNAQRGIKLISKKANPICRTLTKIVRLLITITRSSSRLN